MFSNTIRELSLSGAIADSACPGITASSFNGDVTFVATLRAIMYPRGISVSVSEFDISTDDSERLKERLADIAAGMTGENQICVLNHSVDSDTITGFIQSNGLFRGFVIDEFLSKKMSYFATGEEGAKAVNYLVNEEEKRILILVHNMTVRVWHNIQSVITTAMSWMKFDLDNEEKAMLVALVHPDKRGGDYIDAVEKLATRCNLQDAAKRYYLDGFENRAVEEEKNRYRHKLESLMEEIRNISNRLADTYAEKARADAVYAGLLNSGGESRHELMDYFLANRKLHIKDVQDSTCRYFVAGFLDNWDPDNFESVYENRDSCIYDAFESSGKQYVKTEDDFRELLKSIFIDETVKVKMCSSWRMSLGGSFSPESHADFPAQLRDYLPNPHLQHHGCMGTFQRELERAANDRNYIYGVDITSYENGNVNWLDSIVAPEFINDLLNGREKKYFVLPDGSSVDLRGVMEYLNNEKA